MTMATTPESVKGLERRISTNPDDATAQYQLAVLLLATRDLYAFHSPDDSPVLARAEELLSRAIEIDPANARAHAMLGFTYHQLEDRLERALASFKVARKLDPKDKVVDVYVPTILVAMEKESEALKELTAVARRQGVNLVKLRKDLAEAKFPADAVTLLTNGFISARNYFWSEMMDEAESIRNSLERGRKRRVAREELDTCRTHQRELKERFDPSKVPASIKSLAAAASRYGIGDDPCRALIMKKIPRKTRERLIEQADRLAEETDKWLDSFGSGDKMTTEAAAFMYLLEGIEEIR